MKNTTYIIGTTLIVLSFTSCVVSFWFVFIAAPVFIIGAIVVAFSKKKLVTKLITVIAPLILVLPAVNIVMAIASHTTPVTFLIPAEYEGQFCVVYGEEWGVSPTFEEDRMVLTIPENGILIIQSEFDAGVIDHEYYLVDNSGGRKKIVSVYSLEEISKQMPCVYSEGTGSIGGGMPDGSFSSESPLAITFAHFTVSNKDTMRAANHKTEQLIDSLVNCGRRK